jgi:hypothetical protein
MSYDYFLFAPPADGTALQLETLGETIQPIGSPVEVMAKISAEFPAVRWKPPRANIQAWFGVQGPPEFLITTAADGSVGSIKAAYIERDELDRLIAAMHLVAFDPQTGELFGQ